MNRSRRDFIVSTAVTAASLAYGPAALPADAPAPSSQPGALDFASRQAFDALDKAWNDGQANSHLDNEDGQLAWGECYALQAYLLMYAAHRDPVYIEKLIDHIDRVLKQRDSERKVTEWRGLSLPAWRAVGHYTCGSVRLKDEQGAEVLEVRFAARPAAQNSVTVEPGTSPGTFKLVCTKTPPAKPPITDIYDDLTLTPAVGADDAVKAIRRRFVEINSPETRTMVTARDLRAPGSAGGNPVPGGPWKVSQAGYVYAVHTGNIAYALARFVRTVNDSPELRAEKRFADKAAEYLFAAEQAAGLFDHEWRENTETGEGWFIYSRGCPNPFDGCDQPHNQFIALGAAFVELSAVASTPELRQTFRDRATKIARTFKNDLTRLDNDTYSWTYFWTRGKPFNGWSPKDDVSDWQPAFKGHRVTEDISHAHLDITFAVRCFEEKLGVFDEADMKRLAGSFTKNVMSRDGDGNWTFANSVNGKDGTGEFKNMAPGWMPLAKFERSIYDATLEDYNRRQPKPGMQSVFSAANFNLFSRVGGEKR